MNPFSTLIHNEKIIREAESMLNSFLELYSEKHKTFLYIENPDGTTIRLQRGFKIKDYEIVVFEEK